MRRTVTLLAALLLALSTTGVAVAEDNDDCLDTGEGLEANFINEAPNEPFVVTCDVGIFVDADRFSVDGADIAATVEEAKGDQYGVLVDGASGVRVRNTSVEGEDGYPHQLVHIAFRDGASGVVADNTLDGVKRVGILFADEGTDGVIRNNTITGVGKKTSGWAENGIQVSGGASATVRGNTVADHYWGNNDFASSGIIVSGSDGVTVQHNTVTGGDMGIALYGHDNNAIHNTVETSDDSDTTVFNDGVVVSGDGNGVRQNTIVNPRPENLDIGIIIFPDSDNTKLIRNSIEDFDLPIWDLGDRTKLPAPFDPDH